MQTPGPTPFAAHCASVAQAPQVFVLVSQIGFVGSLEQSLFTVHWTQVPSTAHTGCAESRRLQAPVAAAPQAVQTPDEQIGALDGHC
jgi:hypothetical protein